MSNGRIERWITTDEGNHLPIIDGKISPEKHDKSANENAFANGLQGFDDNDFNEWGKLADETAEKQAISAKDIKNSDKHYDFTSTWGKFIDTDGKINKSAMNKYGKGFSFNDNSKVASKNGTTVKGVFNDGGQVIVENEKKGIYKQFKAKQYGNKIYEEAYKYANGI